MLVVLYFHMLGYSQFEVAMLFLRKRGPFGSKPGMGTDVGRPAASMTPIGKKNHSQQRSRLTTLAGGQRCAYGIATTSPCSFS
jgi:hypothetical protein